MNPTDQTKVLGSEYDTARSRELGALLGLASEVRRYLEDPSEYRLSRLADASHTASVFHAEKETAWEQYRSSTRTTQYMAAEERAT